MCSLAKAEPGEELREQLFQAFFSRAAFTTLLCVKMSNTRQIVFIGRHQVLLISMEAVPAFWWSQLIGGHITWVDLGLAVGYHCLEQRTVWHVNRSRVYQFG